MVAMPMVTRRGALLTLVCAAAAPARAQTALPVVASFSILGDFARQIGGERIALATIVSPGGDAHVYSPNPSDARAVAAARIVIENGLGYEGWMSRLRRAAGSQARLVVATSGVAPRADKSGHDGIDPHAWQSVANARIYVANIAAALIAADPAGRADYEARHRAYGGELDALEVEIRAGVAKIAPARRRIVTTHDAFGYFAQAYGLEFLAPAGVSTEGEISARDVGRIIRQVKQQAIPAVFLENVSDQRLIAQIARESGAKIGGALYSDSLSPPDGPAGTYIAMMRHNINELTKALA